MREDVCADSTAVVVVDEFGIVDAEKRRLVVEDDARRDDRAGQAAAPDFVRSSNGPKTKIAEPTLDH